MEAIYENLVRRARALQRAAEASHQSENPNSDTEGDPKPWRGVIILAGPPGSGKTTIATEVAKRINPLPLQKATTAVVPMDGFHLPRAALDAMPNAAEAYARRGAAWTFDANGVVALFETLDSLRRQPRPRAGGNEGCGASVKGTVFAPSFDHAVKDPVANDIKIGPEISLIILEGNWLLYDVEPWRRIRSLADEAWFVDVDEGLAQDRVARRHLKSGIEDTWEKALHRAEKNDMLNGREVREKLVVPDVRIVSVAEEIASQAPWQERL